MSKVFIIAEAGVNHNGSLKLAKRLVDTAKAAGADAIKFQTFKTEEIITQNAPKATYQKRIYSNESQFDMLKKLELSDKHFQDLFRYSKRKKIIFLSTPFDYQSAEFLDYLHVRMFKISSGDLTNIPFLLKIAQFKKPIILSTGMSSLSEVKEAVKAIYSTGNKKLILLHCTSDYPARYEDVNLKAMDTLREIFHVPVGYSDHTEGIEVAIAAVARGASVIEKHFTLDKGMAGPDHKASLEPDEFKKMVQTIRNVEKSMGTGIKSPKRAEVEIMKVARKSIVAAISIPKGIKIAPEMLAIKRPGIGIKPKYLNRVIGKITRKNIKRDKLITWEDFR